MPLVVPPTAHGSAVDRLANLPDAGRQHGAFCPVEFEAGRIPGQAEKVDEAPALPFLIRDQGLVPDL